MDHLLSSSHQRFVEVLDLIRNQPVDEVLQEAWEKRRVFRPPVLECVYPYQTIAVSVTGRKCSLNCSHCGGHYLEKMVDIKDLEKALRAKRPRSVLLSGGCGPLGEVPLLSFVDRVRELASSEGLEIKINAHPGVMKVEDAVLLGKNVDTISFDFVLDDETIREAFHGHWTGQSYIDTFDALRQGKAEVVPHVLIGLNQGQIKGEYEAVNYLIGKNVRHIIFIVFIPTPGTLWQHLEPPLVGEVVRLLAYARIVKPDLKITLGCMRPGGKYRRELDRLALSAGVDSIVLPAREVLEEAKAKGLSVSRREECCAFE